jgi:hypothetical protein
VFKKDQGPAFSMGLTPDLYLPLYNSLKFIEKADSCAIDAAVCKGLQAGVILN